MASAGPFKSWTLKRRSSKKNKKDATVPETAVPSESETRTPPPPPGAVREGRKPGASMERIISLLALKSTGHYPGIGEMITEEQARMMETCVLPLRERIVQMLTISFPVADQCTFFDLAHKCTLVRDDGSAGSRDPAEPEELPQCAVTRTGPGGLIRFVASEDCLGALKIQQGDLFARAEPVKLQSALTWGSLRRKRPGAPRQNPFNAPQLQKKIIYLEKDTVWPLLQNYQDLYKTIVRLDSKIQLLIN
uniref:ORF80 n=1 Tax=Latid herpesvirus 1 TaxID=3096545 RepID=A0AB33V934_9VIRU